MKEPDLSPEEFVDLFRRWARRIGVDVTQMDDKTLHDVYAHHQQQSPLRMNNNNGNKTLNVGHRPHRQGMIYGVVQLTKAGEVWSITQNLFNHEKTKFFQDRVLNVRDTIPPQFRAHIESAAKFIKPFMTDEVIKDSAYGAASSLYRQMVERDVVPARSARRLRWHPFMTGQDVEDELVHFMARVEKIRRLRAIRNFRDLLEPDLKALVSEVGQQGTLAYNWMNAGKSRESRYYRHQFVRLYPMIAQWAIGRSSVHGLNGENGKDLAHKLTQAIDAGDSIPPVLEGFFREQRKDAGPFLRSSLKFLLALKPDDVPTNVKHKIYDLTAALSHVNPNWYPKTPSQWLALTICVNAFGEFSEHIWKGMNQKAILEETKGQWEEYAALIEAHGRVADIEDWEKAIRQKVILPRLLALNVIKGKNTYDFYPAKEFYAGLKFFDILGASHRWHAQQLEFSGKIMGLGVLTIEGGPLRWLPIDEAKRSPNGIDCIPLTTQEELQAQHKAQAHCVDRYAGHCLYEKSHIIRLEKDKTILTTVELREVWEKAANKPTGVKIQQHQGYKRRRAFPEEEAAINWYIAGLKPDWDRIVAHKEGAKKTKLRNEMLMEVGFDPRDEAARQEAFNICRPYFASASQRNMGYLEWFERMGIEAKIRTARPAVPHEQSSLLSFEDNRRFG